MRAPCQIGDFPFPVKYGYMAVGEVVGGPMGALGSTVFALHPHQDVFDVPERFTVRVPDGVPARRAALAANMETAVNVAWDTRAGAADLDGLDADLVVHASGTDAGLRACLDLAGQDGRIVEAVEIGRSCVREADSERGRDRLARGVDVHESHVRAGDTRAERCDEQPDHAPSDDGDAEVALPLGGPFHARRLTIASSQVGSIPPERAPRWGHGRRLALALDLLRDPAYDALLTHEAPFEDAPRAVPAWLRDPTVLAATLSYS